MATSQDLLHVDPKNEFDAFLLKKDSKVEKRKPAIKRLEGSSILNHVKDFLPLLATANQTLEKEMLFKPLSEFDIEHVENGDHYVEMNIGLFEKDTQSSSDESSDSDEEQICKMLSEVTEDNMKLSKDTEIKPKLISEIKTDVNKNIRSTKMSQKKVAGVFKRPQRNRKQR